MPDIYLSLELCHSHRVAGEEAILILVNISTNMAFHNLHLRYEFGAYLSLTHSLSRVL
jgi:hypothetical protein